MPNSQDADWALDIAERALSRPTDGVSDKALIYQLSDAAGALFSGDRAQPPEDSLIAALAIVGCAVRRRKGIWKAVLENPENLRGRIRQVRLLADKLMDPTNPCAPIHSISEYPTLRDWASAVSDGPAPDSRAALRWLLIARARIRSEHPPFIHFSPDFYRSLLELDDEDCLIYAPTQQQLAAAALLLNGTIVEMDAGEGKTLASAIAATIFAAAGRQAHILTANDYLAARDCDDLAFTMESLGRSPGLVTANMDSDERRFQYARSIVFATVREIGFDYLRDSIASRKRERVSPAFDVAIVDEADHLLIDQARAPLIIAGEPIREFDEDDTAENVAIRMIDAQTKRVDALYDNIQHAEPSDRILATILLAEGLSPRLASTLERLGKSSLQLRRNLLVMNDDDEGNALESDLFFAIEAADSDLRITALGWEFIADRVDDNAAAFEVAQALRARVVHDAGDDYVADDDGVTLVDRLDGRPMASHRYVDGLHEAIEAKEEIAGKARANAAARATIHALMSNYATIAGLTGTAIEAADAFIHDYGSPVVRIPPTFAPRRADLPTRVFFQKSERANALLDEVARWRNIGRPILIAFRSVRESDTFSDVLKRQGIPHRLLNASNPSQESEIVARAGEFGAVTVSTGMAGRGTDIVVEKEVNLRILERLGQANEQAENGLGLLALIASLPASPRAERQLRGRAARQGSPGASQMALYVNDPVLAFSRQQATLYGMRKRGDSYVAGEPVEELLRQVQSEAESRSRDIVEATAGFAAIIESESRSYYERREAVMDAPSCRNILERDASEWVERQVAPLRNIRSNYRTAFGMVADRLWDEYQIDIGAPEFASPNQAADLIESCVDNRLFQHRTRLGDRRFALTVSDMYLDAFGSLWPDHLSSLQDIALSIMSNAESRAAALIQFAEEAIAARSKLRATAADAVIASLLNSEYIEPPSDLEENEVERLPSELSDLIT